jgi:aspartyl-tRNA(Asn)/glutamyl-tRNA(Gln) amidotransferase subunit C
MVAGFQRAAFKGQEGPCVGVAARHGGQKTTRDNNASPLHFSLRQGLASCGKAAFYRMPLTLDDVSRIAELARLELRPGQADALLDQLNGFFRIVEQMSAVDTAGVEPLYSPLSAVQAVSLRLREDRVTEADERAANQRSAPAVEAGLYLVPRVIE